MNLKFAKAPAEADVLVVAELLVAKHQNAAIMKGGADCGERWRRRRLAQDQSRAPLRQPQC